MGEKQTKKILIADDDQLMTKALTIRLVKAGFLVKNVLNGKEVLDSLANEQFDLVILDLAMSTSGFEVLEELKKRSVQLPIIVYSALAQEGDLVKTLGAKEYFVKSKTRIEDVVASVEKLLGN